jgi:hypothetical protein
LRRAILAKALLLIISVSVTLAVVEIGLRIANYPKPTLSGWKTISSYKSERHQLGFRGQPIEYADDDFVIVLVGDSQVEAKASAYGWMPEQRLQFYLNAAGKRVKVFSLGGPATGQDQQLLSLREYYKQFRADMVLLWFTPANDVWNNTFPSGTPDDRTPKPTFWLEGGQLRGPTEETGQPVRETPSLKLKLLWRKYFPWPREKEWASKILPPPYEPMREYNGPVSDEWQKRLDAFPDYLHYENFDTDKNDRALMFTPRSPRVQYGLDLTHSLLQEIEKLAASHAGRFAIFRMEEKPPPSTVYVLNGKYYKVSSDQYEENLKYITRDFDTFMVAVTVQPANVGPEDAHLNEHANDQVMKDLAAKMERLIPAKP